MYKNYFSNFSKIIFFVVLIILNTGIVKAQLPYSTDNDHLTIWNGTEYVPFFIKGVNLGVAVPGTFPGQMAATRSDYSRWLTQIQEAGFNCIRLYTLHFPRFYEVLDSFNTANPHHPLLFIQGVWLEEEYPDYTGDLYDLADPFKQEMEENVDCVHGDRTISERVGKAYGTYSSDVSQWCLAYIIGREVYPDEVLTTNEQHLSTTFFNGSHFSISDASAAEVWVTNMLDYAVSFEQNNYQTQRPISASSWPTLDPISHPEEKNLDEDKASVDLSKIEVHNAPAGLFISYHAYPYYPDFVSQQSSYQTYTDDYGPNSYIGYLTELKSHYEGIPLIIAEYGVPSSWAIAHYATSGMNHGGFDEYNQGLTNLRLLESIRTAGSGGGIQFAWIDEWFKRTWVTDPIDHIAESRILWHNEAAAEQNYGLVAFQKNIHSDTLIKMDINKDITYLNSAVNHSFFELEIGLKNPLDIPDELWVTFDTYDSNLGESLLPSGEAIPSRSEFALHITNYSAQLMVTEAYDIFGIWHQISPPEQLYHSVATDGAPWNIVRIKNNSKHADVQYIGNLQVNYDFQPPSSKDAVTISNEKIKVRIPWFYLNMVAPDQMKVFDDDRNTLEKEITVSDGFKVAVLYNNQWYSPAEHYKWDPWVRVENTGDMEVLKESYYVMKNNLHNFNTPAIAVRDSFEAFGDVFPATVDEENGVLMNDFNLDGETMVSLITENPKNGKVDLRNDGSFDYIPDMGFVGYDSFQYCIYDGYTLSEPNVVIIRIDQHSTNSTQMVATKDNFVIYPNPVTDVLHIESDHLMEQLQIFSSNGQLIKTFSLQTENWTGDISDLQPGIYMVVTKSGNRVSAERISKIN